MKLSKTARAFFAEHGRRGGKKNPGRKMSTKEARALADKRWKTKRKKR